MPQKRVPVTEDGSVRYFEIKIHMESGAMQDEINQMIINGIRVSIINLKVGIRCDHVRIYDYSDNVVISRFRKDTWTNGIFSKTRVLESRSRQGDMKLFPDWNR